MTSGLTRLRWCIAVAASALALAACSSSGSGSPPSSSASGQAGGPAGSSSAAAPTGTPIKIDVVTALSGFNGANYASVPSIAQAWAKFANSQKGIGGHQVVVTTMDTKSDPVTAASIASSIASGSSVSAVIWEDASTEAQGLPKLSAAGIPVVGAFGFTPTLWGALKNVWEPIQWSPQIQYSSVKAAQVAGLKDEYFVTCSEVPGCAAGPQQGATAAHALGMKVDGNGGVGLAAAAPSYTSQCLDMINLGVQNAIISLTSDPAIRFMQECQQQGYKGAVTIIGAGFTYPVLAAADGLQQVVVATQGFPWFVDAPPVVTYRNAMAAAGVPETSYGLDPSTALWTSLELFRKAVGTDAAGITGSVTAKDVITAYGKVKNETLGGLLPQPLTLTANAPQPLMHCFFTISVKDGNKYTALPGGLTPTCLPSLPTTG
jgi:branched-chain amino acid transport system substrate-binding protein